MITLKQATRGLALFLSAAITWILLLSLSGAACLVAAAYLFGGVHLALAVAGTLCIVGAIVIHRGAAGA